MKNKKVLILTPSLQNSGGVANYYSTLQHKLPFDHDFFIVGKREGNNDGQPRRSSLAVRLISDYIRFIKTLRHTNYDLVLINPSLNLNGISRDYVFYLLAKLLRKKTVIFFRGWNEDCAASVFCGRLRLFFWPLLYSDGFIVLAKSFAKKIAPRKNNTHKFIETTIFDESILPDSYTTLAKYKQLENNKLRLLFLSRIEKDKGVYEAINAYKQLRANSVNIELVIAGNGTEDTNVKMIVQNLSDSNISYAGRVAGSVKRDLLLSSSILLFPTTHAEGMPNTVLEAMGCGLAVLSPKVGGLCDFFDGKLMGCELKDDHTTKMISSITKLDSNRALLENISRHNYEYAKKYFHSSVIAARLNNILDAVIDGTTCNKSWYDSK